MNDTEAGLILIVDDNPTNLDVLRETLEEQGFEVAIAISGERAIQQVKQDIPDLILLDVMMPGIDGFETCRCLKSLPLIQSVPIIFMTALSDTTNKVKALELGAVDYITKPFEAQEVLARVRTHLKLHHLTQTLEQEVNRKVSMLRDMQMHLIQREKMSALGNLVAGVAHEINNPLGFLNGSAQNLKEIFEDFWGHLNLYQQHYPNPVPAIAENAEDIDLQLLSQDLHSIFESMQGAIDRIKNISTSLRIFSRTDTEQSVKASLHDGLDSTLLILKYRLKANEQRPAINVIQDYGEIPELDCFPGQLNQVFMNLLANAIDMFDELAQGQSFTTLVARPQQITIRTRWQPNQIQIVIQDNGKGMSPDLQAKIFDQGFTTKPVDKGTGLGLAITQQIITEKHGGSLTVRSTPGEGSEFVIHLPTS